MSELTFNSQNLSGFGVYISGEGTYNAPTRAMEEEIVPGRNGTLLIDGGRWENIIVTYPAFIAENFDVNMARLRNFLASVRGYARLSDSYHPNEFRLASFSDGITVKTSGRYNVQGQFNLSFNCKPQRFLTSGETVTTLTDDGSIENPTPFASNPLIRIYGAGTVEVGDVSITFDGSSAYVDIDSEIQDAYYGVTSKNSAITLTPNRFPTLSGVTGITLDGVTQVDVTPRWFNL
jgi:phage-related protein